MSTKGMQFFYGNYVHEKGEVYPEAIEIIPQYSAEGTKWAARYIWRLRGNFYQGNQSSELSPTQIGTKIQQLRNAYNDNYKDCGFLLDDGSMSQHQMISNDISNLSGNRVVRRSWDNLSETEYANTRSFSFTIESLISQADSMLLSYSEGVSRTGTGGPTWKVRETWNGQPFKYYLTDKSKVVHIQQGEIVSLGTWFAPPLPYWPNEEMQEHRVITQHAPRMHGNGIGTHYRMTYKYVFERLGPDPNFVPNTGYN